MLIQDSFTAAKTGVEEQCEDGAVVTDHFAAVIDGATDKGPPRTYDGMKPGRFAMRVCSEAIGTLDPQSTAEAAAAHITGLLAERMPAGTAAATGPTAVAAIYSAGRREVWQIGDVDFWHAGLPVPRQQSRKTVDRYASEIRAAITAACLAGGMSPGQVAADDPGRAAIRSLLERQGVFKNNPGAGAWAYAALDGTPVDASLISVTPVPAEVSELVLASDGYPAIFPTLQETERHLAALLEEDPLCVGPLAGTKGVNPGNDSYDDRCYLKITV